jgi:hypothetical protein
MHYEELKESIATHLNQAAENFFVIGYLLRQVNAKELFKKDGYTSIWEFSKGEYGLSMSSTSRFMAINARFSVDDGKHMEQKYIGMGVSKLQEMLGLSEQELANVTKETTVREIRDMKKKKLSYFNLPATDSGKGCGDGKYDCCNCSHDCNIRQE